MIKYVFLALLVSMISCLPPKHEDTNTLLPAKFPNGKWGYINSDFKEAISPTFQETKKFVGNYAVIIKNGKYGIINRKGKLLLYGYETIGAVDTNLFVISDLKKITRFGDIIATPNISCPLPYLDKQFWRNYKDEDSSIVINKNSIKAIPGYFCDPVGYDTYIVRKKFKYGLASEDGRLLVDFKYDLITISDFFSIYGWKRDEPVNFAIVRKNKKYGLINRYGIEVIPPEYQFASFPVDEKILCLQNDKLQVFDTNGRKLNYHFEIEFESKIVNKLKRELHPEYSYEHSYIRRAFRAIVMKAFRKYYLDTIAIKASFPSWFRALSASNGLVVADSFWNYIWYNIPEFRSSIRREQYYEILRDSLDNEILVDYPNKLFVRTKSLNIYSYNVGTKLLFVCKNNKYGYMDVNLQWKWGPY
jgi:hypothetical protein